METYAIFVEFYMEWAFSSCAVPWREAGKRGIIPLGKGGLWC